MATRRQLGLGGEREIEGEEYGSHANDGGFDFGAFAAGRQQDFGEPVSGGDMGFAPGEATDRHVIGEGWAPDENGDMRPPGFWALSPEDQAATIALQRDAIAGNDTSARELFGRSRPTTPASAGLPQGVSVEERSQDAPAMPMAPTPVAEMGAQPMQTTAFEPVLSAAPQTGPQRRSHSNAAPALFAESGGARLFGDAGGLMGGGRGVAGDDGGGPTPTEMMLSIMRQLRGGV